LLTCVLVYSAADHAARSNKKTVMPKDVFDAMHDLEFDFMLKRVQDEVERFTSIQADKRNTYRKKVREDKKAAQGSGPKEATSGDADASMNGRMGEPDDDTPPTKRARMESGGEEEDGGDDTVEVEEGDGDEEVEDDEVEEEDEGEEGGDGLTEDPLEEREEQGEDDDMEDGDESD
jgi:DNA polymerase epsilon subunit 3